MTVKRTAECEEVQSTAHIALYASCFLDVVFTQSYGQKERKWEWHSRCIWVRERERIHRRRNRHTKYYLVGHSFRLWLFFFFPLKFARIRKHRPTTVNETQYNVRVETRYLFVYHSQYVNGQCWRESEKNEGPVIIDMHHRVVSTTTSFRSMSVSWFRTSTRPKECMFICVYSFELERRRCMRIAILTQTISKRLEARRMSYTRERKFSILTIHVYVSYSVSENCNI